MTRIGLICVGDEILSGRRKDKHLNHVVETLAAHGLQLSWAQFASDDMDDLVALYTRTFTSGDVVFSCGGIGNTPDDKTREAAARALGRPLVLHPEAKRCIQDRIEQVLVKTGMAPADLEHPENLHRLLMGYFPEGSEIVPNPYNNIPGFYIQNHTFMPGFPEMAWPMMDWTLNTRYAALLAAQSPEISLGVFCNGLPESRLTPAMEQVERDFPSVRSFSLPQALEEASLMRTELGVKGHVAEQVQAAFEQLKQAAIALGGRLDS